MALGTMPTRPALLIKIEDKDGVFGWGEIWANFPPRANIHKAHIVEDVIADFLREFTFVDPREVQAALREKFSVFFFHVGQSQVFEHILAGIDCALWDLALRVHGLSFSEFMKLPKSIAQSYATSINVEDLEQLIPHHSKLGQSYFKLKIGFNGHGCDKIVERALQFCPDGSNIMVDSNQSWTLEQAKDSLEVLEKYSPFFAEEPLRADAPKSDWESLARATDIPLAGGENIYGVDEFLSMTRAGMKVLQPDVAKWGGISGALELAESAPKGVMIWPHFMGTAIGQIAALSVSAAIGEKSFCEIDVNKNELRTQLCGGAIEIENGCVKLPTKVGLVFPPTGEKLEQFRDVI